MRERIFTDNLFEVAFLASTNLDYQETVIEEDERGVECYFLFDGEDTDLVGKILKDRSATMNLQAFGKNLKEFSLIALRDKRDFIRGCKLIYDPHIRSMVFKEKRPRYGFFQTESALEACYYLSKGCSLNRIIIENEGIELFPVYEITGSVEKWSVEVDQGTAEVNIYEMEALLPGINKQAFQEKQRYIFNKKMKRRRN